MQARVGHRFPGGTYRIEHWENFLFSDATGVAAPPDGLAHPAHLFHVAINGVGTSITELFELAGCGPGPPLTRIAYYDWRYLEPLREDELYSLSGGITEFTRSHKEGSPPRDTFTYEIQLDDSEGNRVAEVGFRWHFWRVETDGETA
jgi:hypothetical protein